MSSDPSLLTVTVAGRNVSLRVMGLILIGCAAALAGSQWWSISDDGRYHPKAVLVATFVAVLGIAGVIEPRLLAAMGERRRELPTALRVIGIGIAILGCAGGLALSTWLGG